MSCHAKHIISAGSTAIQQPLFQRDVTVRASNLIGYEQDDQGNDTAGLLSYNLVAQVGNCKSEFATLRSLWSASDLIITLLHQNHTRTIEATTSNSASTHLRLNDTV